MAEADALLGLGLARCEALWAIRGLADQPPLSLFAAADGNGAPRSEATEPAVTLVPMPQGREVVEDYRSTGLSLRAHPVSFLRDDLRGAGAPAQRAVRDGGRAGARPPEARLGQGRHVHHLGDETAVANLIVWPAVFERQRRLVLSASMMACQGRVQAQNGVVHLVAECLHDLSDLLRGLGQRGATFPLRHGRGDRAKHPGSPDQREQGGLQDRRAGDSDVQEVGAGAGIRVPTRDFR